MEMWFCVAKTKASDQSEYTKNQRRIILPREKVFHGASYSRIFYAKRDTDSTESTYETLVEKQVSTEQAKLGVKILRSYLFKLIFYGV